MLREAFTVARMAQMTRRNVLRGAALAATASVLPLPSFAAGKKAPIKLGQCSYSFRNFKPEQMIDMLHQLGLRDLNIKDQFHLPMQPADTVAQRADAYRKAGINLTANGTLYFKTDTDDAVRPTFEYLKAAKINLFVGSPSHEALARVARFCTEYDIRMAIHNHGPEDKEWPSPFDIQKHIEPLDHRVGYCIDFGHTLRAGTDPVEAVNMAGKRLYDCHIKDLADPHSRESQVAVGEGVMPIQKIFQALINIKYPGFVDLEYEIKADDPMPGVRKSHEYMRKVLRDMGYDVPPLAPYTA